MYLVDIVMNDGSRYEKSLVWNAFARMGDHCLTNQNDIEFVLKEYNETYVQYYDDNKKDWISIDIQNTEISNFNIYESDEFSQ